MRHDGVPSNLQTFLLKVFMDTAMPSSSLPSIRPDSLTGHYGKSSNYIFLDVRKAEDFAASDRFVPGMLRWDYVSELYSWAQSAVEKNEEKHDWIR